MNPLVPQDAQETWRMLVIEKDLDHGCAVDSDELPLLRDQVRVAEASSVGLVHVLQQVRVLSEERRHRVDVEASSRELEAHGVGGREVRREEGGARPIQQAGGEPDVASKGFNLVATNVEGRQR
jgi:hypothetical protein